jgi:hypothetical protein
MPTTILEVVQTAATEMGLTAPNSALLNPNDLTAIQLAALYNATGEMLVTRRVWRNLLSTYQFTTVNGQDTYALPADFNRSISQTEWDKTNRWPLVGPETAQQWQWIKSGVLSTGPRERFQLQGNNIVLFPIPGATVLTLTLSYVSKWWVRSALGIAKARATADDDYCVFDSRLMIAGVKMRFFQAKGFDTTAFAADFQSLLDDALGQDAGAPILSMARQPAFPLITIYNLPDGNWPG